MNKILSKFRGFAFEKVPYPFRTLALIYQAVLQKFKRVKIHLIDKQQRERERVHACGCTCTSDGERERKERGVGRGRERTTGDEMWLK